MGDLLTRLSLSHPEISFQFINNGQSKLHTSGNGNLKDVIYHIYGREITSHLLPVSYNANGIQISGFVGEPIISRGNRNFENYFINGRYVKSNIISKAIEDAYKDFTMQHKYPFTVLHLSVDGETVDVNVHPTKMELRFSNQQQVYNCVCEAVGKALHQEELIPHVELPDPHPPKAAEMPESKVPSSGEKGKKDLDYFMTKMRERVLSYHEQNSAAEVKDRKEIFKPERQADRIKEAVNYRKTIEEKEIPAPARPPVPESVQQQVEQKTEQLNFFDEKLLTKKAVAEYKIIGQVFETYWLVEFRDDLYIIDQHAAHERVLYEKTLAGMKTRDFTSQMISPPIILDLSMKEAQLLNKYIDRFTRIGFEIEEFGQDSYAVRAVPDNLFSIAKKELLMEMIDNLSDELATEITPDIIDEKVASMSCKAAVKGNMKLSAAEVETLIGELLELDNPYHCPHGRPTIIAMSKRELEKKFKRIV